MNTLQAIINISLIGLFLIIIFLLVKIYIDNAVSRTKNISHLEDDEVEK